jgi:hypothetical protein
VARRELALENFIAKLGKFHLLVLRYIDYVSKGQAKTSLRFELIGSRRERKSGRWRIGQALPGQGHDGGGGRPPRPPRHHSGH